MGLLEDREQELRKYQDIYAHRIKVTSTYGFTNHWSAAWPWLKRFKTICDVGTGYGHFPIKMATETDAELAVGIDFAMPAGVQFNGDRLKLICAPAHDIPLGSHSIDFVTAFDVLEHLLPEEVDDVIKEFKRVASKGLVLSIADFPHDPQGIIQKYGHGLHRTVENKEWWTNKLTEAGFDVGFTGKYYCCSCST